MSRFGVSGNGSGEPSVLRMQVVVVNPVQLAVSRFLPICLLSLPFAARNWWFCWYSWYAGICGHYCFFVVQFLGNLAEVYICKPEHGGPEESIRSKPKVVRFGHACALSREAGMEGGLAFRQKLY